MLKFSYRFLVVLLVLAFTVGCRRAVELIDAKDTSLQPINLLLKIAGVDSPSQDHEDPFLAPQSQVICQDDAMGITVTRSVVVRTPPIDEVIKDLNIFLFHKERDTIVRHYYIVNSNPAQPLSEIRLDNLYVGNYDFYVVANNGRNLCDDHDTEFGCTHRRADMADMMSSKVLVNSSFNMMVCKDESFVIKTDQQKVSIALNRLTSRFTINFVNQWNKARAGGASEYIEFENYSIVNVPVRARLFGNYTPARVDLDNRTALRFSGGTPDHRVETFTMLNNPQGDVPQLADPSYMNRNAFNAPANASCVTVYAQYFVDDIPKSISYQIYLGGPGYFYNNYDIIKGYDYRYVITFRKPDTNDPRITTFLVREEDKLFVDQLGQSTNFYPGTILSRPLSVEYSSLLDNELYLSCENTIVAVPDDCNYQVYAVNEDGSEQFVGQGAPIKGLKLPVTSFNSTSNKATSNIRITYVQNVSGESYITLSLKTKLGQLYQIRPNGKDTYQWVRYY